ncbi:Cytochrome c-type protein NrfH [bioreactor metagenome]|uniref:Cytochrome c-type protein NrfH n=1 Tax=bioreactor metagenome TaxID=1076179 RepID=A0A644TNP6_9ZZZZ|nr:NapC/NirT family cytochrome c [Negativicutes bacterium]
METGDFLSRNAIKLILLGVVAAVLGMGLFGAGFAYADNPRFCGSCHSMQHVTQTWQASNHKQFSCGDCHLPQDSLVAKLYTKGENGMRHTYHEVLRDYPDNIRFTENARVIANKNCLRCHASTVEDTFMVAGEPNCTKCHRTIPHRQSQPDGGIKVE